MKIVKYFIGLCLTVLFICNGSINVHASEPVTDINDFKWYEYSDGTVTITDYIGTDETVIVPSEIEGKKVTSIAFQGLQDSRFVNVTLPDTIQVIDDMAFDGCTNLEDINLPDGITKIGEYAFYDCKSLKSISLPNGLKLIGQRTFQGCISLKNINLPNSLKDIGQYAFSRCSSLANTIIPDGVVSIGNYSFANCTSLTRITIPDSVTSIGDGVFVSCNNLTSITIPNSVTSIGDGAFNTTLDDTGFTIHANPNSYARTYAEQNGIKFKCLDIHSWDGGSVISNATATNDGTKIYICTACKIKKTEKIPKLGLPKKGKLIAETKSQNAYKVTKSSSKNGTVELTKANKSKSSITVPSTISIDGIDYKVTSVSKNAFKNNKKLKKITIGKNVKTIGSNAFYGCKNLKTIVVQSTQLKTIGKNTFKGIYSKAKIKVPKNRFKSYKKLFNKKGLKKTVKIIK